MYVLFLKCIHMLYISHCVGCTMPFPSKGLVYDYQLDDGGASGRSKGDDDDDDDKKTSAGTVCHPLCYC